MQNRERLRSLAGRWMECAVRPVMAERKRIWAAVNDLKQIRPAILVETCLMTDYVTDEDLQCEGLYERQLEKFLLENIRHADEVGDDFVLEPHLRIPWAFSASDFGVDIPVNHAVDAEGDSVATTYVHPIVTPADVERLKPRTFSVDRKTTNRRVGVLNELFGDILPVFAGGIDQVYGADGYSPWCGMHITEITLNLYMLAGMNNIYFWLYDEPELFHRLMRFLTDDFVAYNRFLESENLLAYNADNALTGGRYGYITETEPAGNAALKDLWLWCHAEETTTLSPEMFKEFILPYLSEAAALYGKTYFGCCENIDLRWELIRKGIPHLKGVSVSPFSDLACMGEYLGKDYVYSRKPHSAPIAYRTPDMDAARRDIADTLKAAKGCNTEIILRDVYRLYGRRQTIREWTDMVRSMI